MSGEKIKLVAGDTRPQLKFTITDDVTGLPIDVSEAGATVKLKFRQIGAAVLKDTMECGKMAGLVREDGSIDYTGPYAIPGAGGRAYMDWSATALDTPGEFEGEIEITFADGGVQTVFETLKFKVRSQY